MRDKWIAHRDPNAFNNRDQFLSDNNLELNDFEILINLAERLINKHFGQFQDTEVDYALPSNDITELARIINERGELLYFLEQFDTLKRKPDFPENISKIRDSLKSF